ncbi:MAG: hypothetical protein GY874_18255 [Desulfobacteraceae bacterium]|nr:hypothetical protein [Desulfobacteraceae bacterium]
MKTFEKIKELLLANSIEFLELSHIQTFTSQESARIRGEDIKIGGKAILIKVDNTFKLFVLSAELTIDSKKIRQHFKAKKVRFATQSELIKMTGLPKGAAPPFGYPILAFELNIDPSILHNEKIAFNAGSLTHSIIMKRQDYIRIANGDVFSFSKAGKHRG